MSRLREPRFETLRRTELRDELIARAKVWLDDWRPRNGVSDFAGALFEIAARLESEVAQRLDRIPEKTFRGFLHWLGVRGQAGRAGRLPVVFALTAGSEPVLAVAPVALQATPVQSDSATAAEPVNFETEQPLMIVPGRLAAVVGAQPKHDTFYLPAAGFSSLEAPKPGPSDWTVKSEARAGATQLQLEPTLGLDALPTLVHPQYDHNLQYRVTKVEGGLVTIEPPLGTGLTESDHLVSVPFFDPFGDDERNRQQHALYIGSESILNLPTEARIQISGLSGDDVVWSYWGKLGKAEAVNWQTLTIAPGAPGLTLVKVAGSVEVTEIGGRKSRWLRATIAPGKVHETRNVSHLSLTVNCDVPGASTPYSPGSQAAQSRIAVEGIANTTPLVLDAPPIYPLGREPRLFDAFYLGCPEAFSKKNASVRIHLEAADGTATAFTAAQVGTAGDTMFFAIGVDGNLYRVHQEADPAKPIARLSPVRPPFTEAGVASVKSASVSLNRLQPRLSTISRENDILVATTAGTDVWVWSQNLTRLRSRWHTLGAIPRPPQGAPPISDEKDSAAVLLLTDGKNIRVIARAHGLLYEANLTDGWETGNTPNWMPVPIPKELNQHKWRQITPVFSRSTRMKGAAFANGWIALDTEGMAVLFMPDIAGRSEFRKKLGVGKVKIAVSPLAVRLNRNEMLFVAQKTSTDVAAWRVQYEKMKKEKKQKLAHVEAKVLGGSFDWSDGARDDIAIVFAKESMTGFGGNLTAWFPLATKDDTAAADKSTLYLSQPINDLNGAPALTADHVVVPGVRAQVITMPFTVSDLVRTNIGAATLGSALVVENAPKPPALNDFLETRLEGAANSVLMRIVEAPKANGANRFWLKIPASVGGAVVDSAILHQRVLPRSFTGTCRGTSSASTEITAEADDEGAVVGGTIVVTSSGKLTVHTISDVVQHPTTPWTFTVQPKIPGAATEKPVQYEYVAAITSPTAVLPLLHLQQSGALPPNRVAPLKANGAYFHGATPSPNSVLFLHPPSATPFEAAVLAEVWTDVPTAEGGKFSLVTAGIFGEPVALADTKTGNPVLSWEYWDGQAWWKIKELDDQTSELRSTGVVSFCVPPGLQPTDVAGRKSHWIRARLVGGDYGQERVTLRTQPDPVDPTISVQTVERSLSGISPPLLVSVDLRYSVCCASNPDYVITADGGGIRDQTEANTIKSAQVELFMSLAESIRRATSAAPGTPDDGDRAIYLGFDAPLSGGPISVLFLVKEGEHEKAYPLRVDVLREKGFEPVVAEDGTRGLNESGVLSFSLSSPPPAVALFGSDARYWLRLRPSLRLQTDPWRPRIRGAYLNAAFARASETQDFERLGSSDGSPKQRVFLGRPPVLEGTLELRVREPLGEEEVQELRDQNPDSVLDQLANGQAGPWVLWTRVDDPDDGATDARVYALNHETGEIVFGDGIHGRIPPIGRNSIVAIRYKRGGGAAANRVAAWSQINLISPVQGVERVVAPEAAAGGSDPQTADEVIQFAPANQFMRDRGLTLRDLEMLTLQFSRDVAQARALQSRAGVRLIVVMRGLLPEPTQAQHRELSHYLAARTSPMLAAPGAITIIGPQLVEVRVNLMLTIDSIEHSGDVARDVKQRIASLLDPAVGGIDKTGWRLGDLPTDADIAAELDDVDHLEDIDKVEVVATIEGQTLVPLQPADLVTLASEGINIQFATSNEQVPA